MCATLNPHLADDFDDLSHTNPSIHISPSVSRSWDPLTEWTFSLGLTALFILLISVGFQVDSLSQKPLSREERHLVSLQHTASMLERESIVELNQRPFSRQEIEASLLFGTRLLSDLGCAKFTNDDAIALDPLLSDTLYHRLLVADIKAPWTCLSLLSFSGTLDTEFSESITQRVTSLWSDWLQGVMQNEYPRIDDFVIQPGQALQDLPKEDQNLVRSRDVVHSVFNTLIALKPDQLPLPLARLLRSCAYADLYTPDGRICLQLLSLATRREPGVVDFLSYLNWRLEQPISPEEEELIPKMLGQIISQGPPEGYRVSYNTPLDDPLESVKKGAALLLCRMVFARQEGIASRAADALGLATLVHGRTDDPEQLRRWRETCQAAFSRGILAAAVPPDPDPYAERQKEELTPLLQAQILQRLLPMERVPDLDSIQAEVASPTSDHEAEHWHERPSLAPLDEAGICEEGGFRPLWWCAVNWYQDDGQEVWNTLSDLYVETRHFRLKL